MNPTSRFLTHLRRNAKNDEGSLIMALLLMLILTSLVFLISASVVAGSMKTAHSQATISGNESAAAGLASAMMYANSQKDLALINESHAITFINNRAAVTWFATPNLEAQGCDADALTANPGTCTSFTIDAYAKTSLRTAHLAATISGITTHAKAADGPADKSNAKNDQGASNKGGTVTYAIAQGFGFTQAAFGDKSVTLNGPATVDSYDSNGSSDGAGSGTVASNGNVTLRNGATADKVVLWDYQSQPFADRCLGEVCARNPIIQQPARLDIATTQGLTFIDNQIEQNCISSGHTPGPWIASAAPNTGLLAPTGDNTNCYSSLDFDQNTTISGTPSKPTIIYVTGSVTVRPNVNVNINGSTPNATSLIIYSRGSIVTLGAQSAAAWALWAPLADCNVSGSTSASTNTYGSMICSRLTSSGAWNFHYDKQVQKIAVQGSGLARVWSITGVTRK